MNPNDINHRAQNQSGLYKNYASGLITNQFQGPNMVNNPNEIIYPLSSPQIIKTNFISSGYNPVNIIQSQTIPTNQILVPTSNIISNQPFARQIQIQNNNVNISYNPVITANQNMIQAKSNKIIPIYEQDIIKRDLNPNINNNQNIIKSGDNLPKNKVKNEVNKNGITETKRTDEAYDGHLPIPFKLSQEIGESISKFLIIIIINQIFLII